MERVCHIVEASRQNGRDSSTNHAVEAEGKQGGISSP
jgi:hypothetical protein